LLLFVVTVAEGLARVRPSGPGGLQPQRAEEGTGQGGTEPTQRFAAGNGLLRQRFRELIDAMGHGSSVSSWKEFGSQIEQSVQVANAAPLL
jgi:hypothetical protein